MQVVLVAAVCISLFAIGDTGYPPNDMVVKPTLLKNNYVPAKGLLTTASDTSFLHCTFLCIQNVQCWRFSFGPKGCNLYEPVHPVPNPEFLEAEGYATYQARKKIFKMIKGAYKQQAANNACKSKFGSRLACSTDIQSSKLLATFAGRSPSNCPPSTFLYIGLFPKGNSGIFEWTNGETIDVVNGTGFQKWGKTPVKYKTGEVAVAGGRCKSSLYWFEVAVGDVWWVICEMP